MTLPVAPHAVDKTLRRGAEYRLRLQVLKPSGAPQPITGATFTANVRTGEAKDATVIFDLTQTIASALDGIIDFSLNHIQTGVLSAGIDYWVSVYVIHASWTGGVDRLELHGKLEIVG